MLIEVFALASGCDLMKDIDEVVKDGKGKHVKPGLINGRRALHTGLAGRGAGRQQKSFGS